MKLQLNRDQLSLIYEFGVKAVDADGFAYYQLPQVFRTSHDGNMLEVLEPSKTPVEILNALAKKK